MRAVNTSAGDAKFVMIAKGMLRATKAALLGSPLGLDSSAYMAQYRVEGELRAPRCMCCVLRARAHHRAKQHTQHAWPALIRPMPHRTQLTRHLAPKPAPRSTLPSTLLS